MRSRKRHVNVGVEQYLTGNRVGGHTIEPHKKAFTLLNSSFIDIPRQ